MGLSIQSSTALAAALLLAIAAIGFGTRGDLHETRNLEVEWPLNSSGERHLHMSVPRNYVTIDGGFEVSKIAPMPGGMRDRTSAWLLMHLLWPEMTGRDPTNGGEFEVRGGGRAFIVALNSPARDVFDGIGIDELNGEWGNAFANLTNVCVPTGLPMPRNVNCTKLAPQIDSAEFGLHKLARDFKTYPIDPDHSSSAKDLFEDRDSSGALRTFIACSAAGVETPLPTTPQCAQYFVDTTSNSLVRTVYRKEYLAQWRQIQAATSTLLVSFVHSHS